MKKLLLAFGLLSTMTLFIAAGCASDESGTTTGTETTGTTDANPADANTDNTTSSNADGGEATPAAFLKDGKVWCPVMNAAVADKDKAKFQDYEGTRYYFCCDGCPEKFKADPAKYAAKKDTPETKSETETGA